MTSIHGVPAKTIEIFERTLAQMFYAVDLVGFADDLSTTTANLKKGEVMFAAKECEISSWARCDLHLTRSSMPDATRTKAANYVLGKGRICRLFTIWHDNVSPIYYRRKEPGKLGLQRDLVSMTSSLNLSDT